MHSKTDLFQDVQFKLQEENLVFDGAVPGETFTMENQMQIQLLGMVSNQEPMMQSPGLPLHSLFPQITSDSTLISMKCHCKISIPTVTTLHCNYMMTNLGYDDQSSMYYVAQ